MKPMAPEQNQSRRKAAAQAPKNAGSVLFAHREECFYERLGIKRFRRFVLWLENRLQRITGRKNRNYHLGAKALDGLETYSIYIKYNALVHGIVQLYLLAAAAMEFYRPALPKGGKLLLLLLFAGNGYCLMLQRYNSLRLRRTIDHLSCTRARIVARQAAELRPCLHGCTEYLGLIKRLRDAVEGKTSIWLSPEDGRALAFLADRCPAVLRPPARPVSDDTLSQKAKKNVPYHGIQQAAALLSHKQLCFPILATATAETERAFSDLFGTASVWSMETRLKSLELAITGGESNTILP